MTHFCPPYINIVTRTLILKLGDVTYQHAVCRRTMHAEEEALGRKTKSQTCIFFPV